MKAKDAIIGQLNTLEQRGNRPKGPAECSGWNASHEWLLFLVFDEYGKRKILMVAPTEELR